MGAILGLPDVDPADAAIGRRLKRWRDRRGVGIEALAARLHLTAGALRRAEAGRAHLDSVQIAAATSALHLPLWALSSDTPAY